MKTSYLRALAVSAALVGIVLVSLANRKTITLVIDGESQEVTTSVFTVGGVLARGDVQLSSEDSLQPPDSTWLREGQVIRVEHAAYVQIVDGEETRDLWTPERRVANILAQAGVPLFPRDQIIVAGEAVPFEAELPYAPTFSLQIKRAVEIRLVDGDEEILDVFNSTAATLGEALWEAGITLYAADRLTPPPETPLEQPLTARLQRARQLRITAEGETALARSAAATVGEALASAGLALQGLDYSLPAEDQPPPEDGQIQVVRVTEEIVTLPEPVPFDSWQQPDPTAEIDTFTVIQAGEFGLRTQRVRVRFEDGVEISRRVEDEWLAREPVPRINGYGTKIVVRTLNTPDGPIEYWRALNVYATSYSPCRSGVPDKCYYNTSYGIPAQEGVVAMIRSWYLAMKGWPVYVPGYGNAIIADVGGGIEGRPWIDLAYSDETYQSWHDWTTIYFLTPVPPVEYISFILP